MIISQGRNYIFVHIPKTGGTSMALALEGRAMKDDVLIGDTPKALKRRHRLKNVQTAGRLWKHSTISDVAGLVSLPQMTDAFVFTMVRNPWDRLVSYYHWLQTQTFDHPAVYLAERTDFSGFLNAEQTQRSIRANPYASYVRSSNGKEYCNAFIRLEHIEQDAQPLWDHLGFELGLPHENSSDREKDYRAYYTKCDSNLVKMLCAEDIERFNYQF